MSSPAGKPVTSASSQETDPQVRERILGIVPEETRQALVAQWQLQQEQIRKAEGHTPEELGSRGRPYTSEDVEAYKHARTHLEFGDYLRSRQIARFFFTRKFRLPDSDSAALDPNLDYQDVKLKIVQQEGGGSYRYDVVPPSPRTCIFRARGREGRPELRHGSPAGPPGRAASTAGRIRPGSAMLAGQAGMGFREWMGGGGAFMQEGIIDQERKGWFLGCSG